MEEYSILYGYERQYDGIFSDVFMILLSVAAERISIQ